MSEWVPPRLEFDLKCQFVWHAIDRRATNKKKLWQSVWPDWASFKVRGDKVSYKSCPNIWTLFALLWSKNLCGYFLCIFWQIFTIFLSNIWSHWRQLKIFVSPKRVFLTFKFTVCLLNESNFLSNKQPEIWYWRLLYWNTKIRCRFC